jgi:hypothetical protein
MSNFLKAIAIFATISILAGCNVTANKLTVTTKTADITLMKQPAPRELDLADPHFIVITEKNFESVKAKFMDSNGKFLVYAVMPSDYKILIKNQAELKRYISQQKSIIIYYEKVAGAK